MSTGSVGHGATLVGSTTGTVGNITNLSVATGARDMVDISTMDSTDKFREFIAGMADEGEIGVVCNFDDGAIATAINTAYQGGASETWTVDFGSKTFACTGFVNTRPIEVPFDDKISMSFTIKLSGKGTWT